MNKEGCLNRKEMIELETWEHQEGRKTKERVKMWLNVIGFSLPLKLKQNENIV